MMVSTPCLLRQPLRRAGGGRLSLGRAGDTAQGTPGRGHLAGDTAQGRPGRFPCPSLFAAIPGAGVLEHRLVPQSCWYLPKQVGSTGAGVLLVPPVLPALLQAQALNCSVSF